MKLKCQPMEKKGVKRGVEHVEEEVKEVKRVETIEDKEENVEEVELEVEQEGVPPLETFEDWFSWYARANKNVSDMNALHSMKNKDIMLLNRFFGALGKIAE